MIKRYAVLVVYIGFATLLFGCSSAGKVRDGAAVVEADSTSHVQTDSTPKDFRAYTVNRDFGLRSVPKLNSPILREFDAGFKLEALVESMKDGWIKVTLPDGMSGYAHGSPLTEK